MFPTHFFGHSLPPSQSIPWLWHGYLAMGHITLFTAQWKSGKTTLLSLLLARLQSGGTLAGLPVSPASAFIISEEHASIWGQRNDRLKLSNTLFLCQPFRAPPNPRAWDAFLKHVDALRIEHNIRLIALDTLASLMPDGSELSAVAAMRALQPLRSLTDAGVALLLLHHPNKGKVRPGQAARGTGALSGFADILIEMSLPPRALENDRRRLVTAYSRLDATPRQLLLELNAEATDYTPLQAAEPGEFPGAWPILRTLFEDADTVLSRRDLLHLWPDDYRRPCINTLAAWLDLALEKSLIQMEGTGRRTDPFRYYLPYVAATWKQPDLIDQSLDQGVKDFFRQREEQWKPHRRAAHEVSAPP